MKRQITLDDSQIRELIEFYENKKEALMKKMVELNKQIKDVDALLTPLEDSIDDSEPLKLQTFEDEEITYNPNFSKAKKAAWILNEVGHELTVNVIAEVIGDFEPHLFLNDEEAKREYITQLSSTLGTKAKNHKQFYRIKNEENIYEYGLLEWREPN